MRPADAYLTQPDPDVVADNKHFASVEELARSYAIHAKGPYHRYFLVSPSVGSVEYSHYCSIDNHSR
jgi:hypothetical protein